MKLIIVALATVIHLLPHPFGVSSVGALALYSGASERSALRWFVPLVPLSLGLALTGLYDLRVLTAVLAGFVLATCAGRFFLSARRSLKRFAGAVATGAFIFYALSNFGVWLAFYPRDLSGLIACYVNGLPYLGQAMLADAMYCFVLFGLHAALERRQPATEPS
ncbi:MAG: DUF6580 family putative transport protein [Pseudomonadota bacterium]